MPPVDGRPRHSLRHRQLSELESIGREDPALLGARWRKGVPDGGIRSANYSRRTRPTFQPSNRGERVLRPASPHRRGRTLSPSIYRENPEPIRRIRRCALPVPRSARTPLTSGAEECGNAAHPPCRQRWHTSWTGRIGAHPPPDYRGRPYRSASCSLTTRGVSRRVLVVFTLRRSLSSAHTKYPRPSGAMIPNASHCSPYDR